MCLCKNSDREKMEVGADSLFLSFHKSVSLLFPKTMSFLGLPSLLPQLSSTELQTAELGQGSTFSTLGIAVSGLPNQRVMRKVSVSS